MPAEVRQPPVKVPAIDACYHWQFERQRYLWAAVSQIDPANSTCRLRTALRVGRFATKTLWADAGAGETFGSFVGKKCRSEASLSKRITLKAKISERITKSESKAMTLFRVEELLILRSLETRSWMNKTIRTGQKHRIACLSVSLRSPRGTGRPRLTLYSHRSWRLFPRLSVITESQVANHFIIIPAYGPRKQRFQQNNGLRDQT
jgi:hypothetical protein